MKFQLFVFIPLIVSSFAVDYHKLSTLWRATTIDPLIEEYKFLSNLTEDCSSAMWSKYFCLIYLYHEYRNCYEDAIPYPEVYIKNFF